MKETTVDLRRAAGKREAIKLIYKAIGFVGEAGTNLDALADVLSAWGMPVRIRMLYWKSFCDREPVAAAGIRSVLDDMMVENRNIVAAYCPGGKRSDLK
ncbi:MAG: barstar family protein [Clostridia bacterium]|jgi:RNAse (barnase) inhibitor barstar|nr:barstar family protein [Clostridia bacterium]MBP5730974.1 barstar family protein [Clostridia bacterium]